MRFFEALDGYDQPTIWLDTDTDTMARPPQPILQRCNLEPARRDAWPHIVRALTAGPTIESARVVIDVLNDEIKALRRANDDLNAELTSLRRAHG